VRKLDFMKDQMVFAARRSTTIRRHQGRAAMCRPLKEVSTASRSLIQLMAIAFLIAG
jgi:hypothetical protein